MIMNMNTNKNIFPNVPNNLCITKNSETISTCVDNYISIKNFLCDYIEGIKEKTNTQYEYNKFVELKNEYSDINSRIYNTYLQRTINNSLKDFNSSNEVKTLINVLVYKANIISFIEDKVPLLYLHRYGEADNIQDTSYINQMLSNMVEISKQIGLNENEMTNVIKTTLILNGHFEQVLPLLSNTKLFIYCALLKKRKLLTYSLNENNISFLSYKKDLRDNYYYIFNAYLSTYIVSFFNAIKDVWKQNKIEAKYATKIIEIMIHLEPYSKIYSMLYNVLEHNDIIKCVIEKINKPKSTLNIYHYLKEFISFFCLEGDKLLNKQIMSYIEIGNTISLFLLLNGIKSFSYEQTPSLSMNMQDIISIFALVWEMFKSISHFNYNIKDYIHKIILFSIFSSFGISLIPFNRETLDCNDFRLYSYRNVCVISTKSVLFWEKSEISFKNIKTTFDSHRKHVILSY